MRLSCAVLAAFPLFVGCAALTTTAPSPAPARSATTVAAPAARTWDAVIDMFAERNIPIRNMDRASGFISTDLLAVSLGSSEGLADCGSSIGVPYTPEHATYNVLVRGDSTSSTVRATVRYTTSRGSMGAIECSSKGTWESQFEGQVKARAEAKR